MSADDTYQKPNRIWRLVCKDLQLFAKLTERIGLIKRLRSGTRLRVETCGRQSRPGTERGTARSR
jgi:hypothetical protein